MHNSRALISYNRGDERIARKLRCRIESFRPSQHLDPRPHRIQPVFRGRDEMAAATDLPDKVTAALQNSEDLIVLCSPARRPANGWTERSRLSPTCTALTASLR